MQSNSTLRHRKADLRYRSWYQGYLAGSHESSRGPRISEFETVGQLVKEEPVWKKGACPHADHTIVSICTLQRGQGAVRAIQLCYYGETNLLVAGDMETYSSSLKTRKT